MESFIFSIGVNYGLRMESLKISILIDFEEFENFYLS